MAREFNQKTNCANEILKHVNELHSKFGARIKCIDIYTDFRIHRWNLEDDEKKEFEDKKFSLTEGHALDEALVFFKNLNFYYDSGYGTQELYGTIWFTDGTYSEREEYDGNEGWAHRRAPSIPIQCKIEVPSESQA